MEDIEEILKRLNRDYPIIPFTRASQLSTVVRRMRKEKEMNLTYEYRSGFAISVEDGLAANELSEARWERFYEALRCELRYFYPSLSPD